MCIAPCVLYMSMQATRGWSRCKSRVRGMELEFKVPDRKVIDPTGALGIRDT